MVSLCCALTVSISLKKSDLIGLIGIHFPFHTSIYNLILSTLMLLAFDCFKEVTMTEESPFPPILHSGTIVTSEVKLTSAFIHRSKFISLNMLKFVLLS